MKPKRALRIEQELDCIIVRALIAKRFKVIGFGTFLQNVRPGEISITKKALATIMKSPYRSGLQGMEIFGHDPPVLAWGSPTDFLAIPVTAISKHKGASEWFKRCCVVEDQLPEKE